MPHDHVLSSAEAGPISAPASALPPGAHDHVFLGTDHDRNARRIWVVIAVTAVMMVAEIAAGSIFGSMALLADGWHMATHASALLITALAYRFARRHATDPRFTFGTGKVGDLAAFASAIVLAVVALAIGWESLARIYAPVAIDFSEAIAVAVIGLLVNAVCAYLLRDLPDHGHGHSHGFTQGHRREATQDHGGHDHSGQGFGGHDHDAHNHHAHDHDGQGHQGHSHDHGGAHGHAHASALTAGDAAPSGDDVSAHGTAAPAVAAPAAPVRDNNLHAAYTHVLADALTSILAIAALIAGRFYGWVWLDPVIGIVGALVILRWSVGLMRASGAVLVDFSATSGAVAERIRTRIEAEGGAVSDLHLWHLGPGHLGAIVTVAAEGDRPTTFWRERLAPLGLSHLTVEVARPPSGAAAVR